LLTGAVDIGGTKIAVAVVSDIGSVAGREEWPTRLLGPNDAVARMAEALTRLAGQSGTPLRGVGIGCTGPVDPLTGIVGDVDLLPGWSGFGLAEQLSNTTGLGVAIENDADAAALAEAEWGAGRGTSRFIYVTISTGIGTGMVFDGQLYRGAGGAHPEAGHQLLDPAGPACYCGARGCWESLASGTAMEQWARSQSAEFHNITAKDICRLAGESDPLALRVVDRECEYLGIGLANLVTMLCPDAIALGGGVMQSADLFLDRVRSIVRARCGLVPAGQVIITRAALGGDAPLLGAARVWQVRSPQVRS